LFDQMLENVLIDFKLFNAKMALLA
jgi:hypothetical protein